MRENELCSGIVGVTSIHVLYIKYCKWLILVVVIYYSQCYCLLTFIVISSVSKLRAHFCIILEKCAEVTTVNLSNNKIEKTKPLRVLSKLRGTGNSLFP